jgi:hypothetical protein
MLRCNVAGYAACVFGGTDETSDVMFGWGLSMVRAQHRRRATPSRFVGHDRDHLQFWDGKE